MNPYSTILKAASLVFFAVAAVHLTFGLGADQMLGANLLSQAINEPSLDSQNRFYGVAFAFYGVAFYVCATDLQRYRAILVGALAVFFLAGCARFVSWWLGGARSPLVMGLLASELALPPVLYAWLRKILPSA